jgi:hypothetical protein
MLDWSAACASRRFEPTGAANATRTCSAETPFFPGLGAFVRGTVRSVPFVPFTPYVKETSMFRVGFLSILVLAAAASASPSWAQTEITTCGQVVVGDAFLSADLDCTGFDGNSVVPEFEGKIDPPVINGAAVVVSRKGTVDLQGHTLTAGTNFGVFCPKSCAVVGGGTIVGSGIADGVLAQKTLTIRDTTITGAEVAIFSTGLLRMYGSTVTGNTYGTWYGKTAKIVGSSVTGNTNHAITADKIELVDSTVTGNGLDLGAKRKPKLKNSTCETSTWGPDHLDVCGGS